MKLKIVVFLTITTAVILLGFGGKQLAANLTSSKVDLYEVPQIPDYVLYESVFRLDLSFRKKALEQKLSGQAPTALEFYFKDEAGLTVAEDEELRKTAIAYLEAIQPIDAQAVQILAQIREQFPDGQVPEGQSVPPPPAELANLQSQRNAVALEYRNRLENAIGSGKFKSFDGYVKNRFAANFDAVGSVRLK